MSTTAILDDGTPAGNPLVLEIAPFGVLGDPVPIVDWSQAVP